jgi:two-component system sensor histidine kinase/response regulator
MCTVIMTCAGRQKSKLDEAHYMNTMCHEIRTPLAAIIGITQLLAMKMCTPDKHDQCIEMLSDSAKMLKSLLDDMLDSSKICSGMMGIESVEFDLSKIINEIANIAAIQATEKAVGISVNFGNDLPIVLMGDPLRIRQILLNLLSNAIKFTDKGYVSLYVNATADLFGAYQVSITVADTGIGMKEDQLERIFEEYTQATTGTSRTYGGTGLGLSISRQLARLMHGDITVKSWPNMGSQFTITLPLQKVAMLQAAA